MDIQSALAQLQTPHDLTILWLSRPYFSLASPVSDKANKRQSNTSSNEGRENATPAILAADLAHYQELFSKLRFSYVEQVTKERFLRAITAEQPEFVDAGENAELEERLRDEKAALKERKAEVREMVKDLEEQGRQLANRYESIKLQTAQLKSLPYEIENLQDTISTLRSSLGSRSNSSNPVLSLPLQPTLDLLNEREERLADIDRQIEMLQGALPHKHAQVTALQDEMSILNAKKIRAVEEAKEARRRREHGGMGDELEERGRWLKSVETGLRTMLEV